MYHTREASRCHDKVFALLGMSSDDLIAADLLPDYEIPWERLLERLVRFLLGGQVSVKTWAEMEMAVIKSKGCILGRVSSGGDADRDGRLQVAITPKDTSGHLGPERKWALQTSAKPVQIGDLVCLLHGASKPTIIRLCKDHFSVVMIAVPLLQPEQPITSFPYDFLLVWDWLQDREEYEALVNSRMPDKMTRLWNAALILEDAEEYEKAEERLRETVEGYERGLGKADLHTLIGMEKLALIYKKMKQWEKAEKLFKQVIRAIHVPHRLTAHLLWHRVSIATGFLIKVTQRLTWQSCRRGAAKNLKFKGFLHAKRPSQTAIPR